MRPLEALSDLRDRPTGTVRITTTDYATQAYVWPRLKPLLREFPDTRVELINDYGLSDIVEKKVRHRNSSGLSGGEGYDRCTHQPGPDLTMAIVCTRKRLM